jgi:hypothetical protein
VKITPDFWARIATQSSLTITKLLPNILSAEALTHVPITHREEMTRPVLTASGGLRELAAASEKDRV